MSLTRRLLALVLVLGFGVGVVACDDQDEGDGNTSGDNPKDMGDDGGW